MPSLSRTHKYTLWGGVYFALPIVLPFLGWVYLLYALPVLYYVLVPDQRHRGSVFLGSLVLPLLLALALQRWDCFFSLATMVPMGYVLGHSLLRNESVWLSGGKGLLTLGIGWFGIWAICSATLGVNLYTDLLKLTEQFFIQMQQNPQVQALPEVFLQQENLRVMLGEQLPGMLLSTAVACVWLNMVLFNALFARFHGRHPWGRFACWRLPEQLVWLFILGLSLMLLGQGTLEIIGAWIVKILGFLYFSQGLSVLMTIFEHWKVPGLARKFLYLLMILQAYCLLGLGLADIWFNFRHRFTQHKS